MRRRSGWIWGGRIVAVVMVAGLGAYLASVGLDKADKLAGVLGLLVAVAALVTPYLLPPAEAAHGQGTIRAAGGFRTGRAQGPDRRHTG